MKLWVVDTFTNKPFTGNPAAVCCLPSFAQVSDMQALASELNLSEIAYVVPQSPGHYAIRWFSPRDEAPLCGHATLASAHILWSTGYTGNLIQFHSRAGDLFAEKMVIERKEHIALNFPTRPVVPVLQVPVLLKNALKSSLQGVFRDEDVYLVVLDTAQAVVDCKPDLELIQQLDCRAVIITAAGGEPYDFVSRYFAPKVGIPEDPVCGSAHCRLTKFWAQRLNKTEIKAYQASRRGGVVHCMDLGERVRIAGQAITIMESEVPIIDTWLTPEIKGVVKAA